jgi:hypothetical protein
MNFDVSQTIGFSRIMELFAKKISKTGKTFLKYCNLIFNLDHNYMLL